MRMKTWESYVKEESFVVELIKIVIDIEFQYASARNVPRNLSQTTNVQSNYHKQVLLQSSLAYHSLYGGQSDEVIVMDSINQSINNRKGIITQGNHHTILSHEVGIRSSISDKTSSTTILI